MIKKTGIEVGLPSMRQQFDLHERCSTLEPETRLRAWTKFLLEFQKLLGSRFGPSPSFQSVEYMSKMFFGGQTIIKKTKCNLPVRYLRLFRESPYCLSYVSSATRHLECQSEQDHHSLAKI